MKTKSNQQGLTLIELVIALAIVAILSVASIMIYTSYVRKGRRVDAISSLLSIAEAEERYRSSNLQYGTLAQVWNGVTSSSEGYYTLSISNTSSTTYTITATAQGNQASDSVNGTSCATLTLTMTNGTITQSPSACWPT